MDASLKTRFVAEAKFVRDYNYFRLVRAYGDVPLGLHYPKSAAGFNIPRTPKAQVYAQIEQDPTDAASILTQPTVALILAVPLNIFMFQKRH